jgi:hypothetical protein
MSEKPMYIKCERSFQASLDDGLTVETFLAGENEVPEWVGKMAIEHYGAEKISKLSKKEAE